MPDYVRNTSGDSTADGTLDALESIEQRLMDMESARQSDSAQIITLLTNIQTRLEAGIRVQVVTSL